MNIFYVSLAELQASRIQRIHHRAEESALLAQSSKTSCVDPHEHVPSCPLYGQSSQSNCAMSCRRLRRITRGRLSMQTYHKSRSARGRKLSVGYEHPCRRISSHIGRLLSSIEITVLNIRQVGEGSLLGQAPHSRRYSRQLVETLRPMQHVDHLRRWRRRNQ